MSAIDTLNKIKEALGLSAKVELESAKLEDGVVVEAESFEAGKDIFIVTDEERIALPTGSYELEDGRVLVVEEEGIIASIGSEESETEEELNTEEMEYASKEELAEVKAGLDEVKAMIEKLMPSEEKEEEMAEEPKAELSEEATEEVKEEVKEELSAETKEEVVESKEEFSQTGQEILDSLVKPKKHSPEAKSSEKMGFKMSPRGLKGTYDTILNNLYS